MFCGMYVLACICIVESRYKICIDRVASHLENLETSAEFHIGQGKVGEIVVCM